MRTSPHIGNSHLEQMNLILEFILNGIKINFTPENIKGEKLTSRAFKEQCVFEFGYLVESEVRIVGGKEKRYQKKTPLSYVLVPAPDNAGGNG